MYPIEIKEVNYGVAIFDMFMEMVKFVINGIISFRSPKTLVVFLTKSFYF